VTRWGPLLPLPEDRDDNEDGAHVGAVPWSAETYSTVRFV